MKNQTLEQIGKQMFRELEDLHQFGIVGGATFRITYHPTLVDGKSDLVAADGLQD